MQPQQHSHNNNPSPVARPHPLHVVYSPTIPPPNRGTRNSELAQGSKIPLTAPLPSRTAAATSPNRKRPTPLVLGKPREAGQEDWEIQLERPVAASSGASDGMSCKDLFPIEAISLIAQTIPWTTSCKIYPSYAKQCGKTSWLDRSTPH